MYEGTNSTALRSQQWIIDALFAMMQEKPYAAITVRDLCSRADLSRQTFYNLFESKEEILHVYLRSEVAKVYGGLREAGRPQLGDTVEAFTQVLESNRENLRLMTRQGLGAVIEEEIAAAVSLFAGSFVDKRGDGTPEGSSSLPDIAGGAASVQDVTAAQRACESVGETASADMDAPGEKDKKDDREMAYAAAFLSGGLAHILLQWTREDAPLAGEELTQILEKILQGEMYRL